MKQEKWNIRYQRIERIAHSDIYYIHFNVGTFSIIKINKTKLIFPAGILESNFPLFWAKSHLSDSCVQECQSHSEYHSEWTNIFIDCFMYIQN